MFKSIFKAAKTLVRNSTTKVVRNKNGTTSTFTKIKKQNGKTSWYKSGGSGSFKKRGRRAKP